MKSLKKKLAFMSWLIVLSFTALTVATYAWMSIATSYEVSDLELTIITENAMELAPDDGGKPGEWSTSISGSTFIPEDAALRPVTWSAANFAFFAPTYGLDGRIDFMAPYEIAKLDSGIPTPSANEAEEGEGAGYLIAVDLWFRTGASEVTVHLSAPERTSEGVMGEGTFVCGAPVWNADKICHENGGKGAENVIRIGFMTYDEEYEDGRLYIYEPNVSKEREPTLSIDGDTSYEGDGKILRQTPTTWSEQDPVLNGSVIYSLGEFHTEDTALFKLVSDTPRRVTLLIWLEGQDAECMNSISAGRIIANLQFGADEQYQQGGIERPEIGVGGNE